jgi:predicted nucleic acid-binding protein
VAALTVFLDTSVLLAGLIDMGPASDPAQAILSAVAAGTMARPLTAWHCCLEFYSVATRLPVEFRLTPADAVQLAEEEIFQRFRIVDLPAAQRRRLLADAAVNGIGGGRVHDLHIAEVARSHRAQVVVTDNVRHFAPLLRYGVRVVSSAELAAEIPAPAARR